MLRLGRFEPAAIESALSARPDLTVFDVERFAYDFSLELRALRPAAFAR